MKESKEGKDSPQGKRRNSSGSVKSALKVAAKLKRNFAGTFLLAAVIDKPVQDILKRMNNSVIQPFYIRENIELFEKFRLKIQNYIKNKTAVYDRSQALTALFTVGAGGGYLPCILNAVRLVTEELEKTSVLVSKAGKTTPGEATSSPITTPGQVAPNSTVILMERGYYLPVYMLKNWLKYRKYSAYSAIVPEYYLGIKKLSYFQNR
jgi:hypothetical protein